MGKAVQVELQRVSCWHGRNQVVNNVALTLQAGEHVALLGSNGSGKSTLLRAILGLHQPVRGHIMLDGEIAVTAAQWQQRRTRIAYMPQRQATGHFPLLVHELLASSGQPAAAQAAAGALGVWQFAQRPLHSLSGGQLQRAFLARAMGMLAGAAGLLLADEPTAALDFAGQAAIAEQMAALPATVLVVTHDRAVAARCHRTVEMAGGQLRAVQP
jgi:ABC-type Mn2+/Zn2+ transport system ATPase subunit